MGSFFLYILVAYTELLGYPLKLEPSIPLLRHAPCMELTGYSAINKVLMICHMAELSVVGLKYLGGCEKVHNTDILCWVKFYALYRL